MTKILIADDEHNVLDLSGEMFRQIGYEVVTALNGVIAVQKAIAEKPDLIILDINMPEMDGMEACKKLRSMDSFASTPIIFLTAQDTKKSILDGLAEGANDYLTKPFNMNDLKESVKNLLVKAKKI